LGGYLELMATYFEIKKIVSLMHFEELLQLAVVVSEILVFKKYIGRFPLCRISHCVTG
jgi:hypothetical protein